jgi:restriction endonuclease S subunit
MEEDTIISQDQLKKGFYLQTLTLVFRNITDKIPSSKFKFSNGDSFLLSVLGKFGKAIIISSIKPGVYRIHDTGIWSSLKNQKQKKKVSKYYLYKELIKIHEEDKEVVKYYKERIKVLSKNMISYIKNNDASKTGIITPHHKINKKNIKSIAKAFAGYTFRTTLKTEEGGRNLVIQAKDMSNNLIIDSSRLASINYQSFKTNALLKENDVIISVRGKFRAGVYKGLQDNIIASSSVYILRLIDKKIYPEYLAIYLNSVVGQKEISRSLTGGAIKTILRKDLENINVVIPDEKKQQIIINLYKNNIAFQDKLNSKKLLVNNIMETAVSKILNK